LKLWSSLVLGATLSGCSVPLQFEIDSAFTADERTQIKAAADDWNRITGQDYKITFDGDSWVIYKRQPPASNGLTLVAGREVWITPKPVGASVRTIARHEFGHALGLRHTAKGVMYAGWAEDEFSAEDLVECRRVGACD